MARSTRIPLVVSSYTFTAAASGLLAAAYVDRFDRRRLMLVLGVTATFMLVEFAGGLLANSLALLADAGHMLNDVAALGLSAFALWFSRRPATAAKSYGYMRIEILAALVNGATLIVISLIILWQAWSRFSEPQEVEGLLMLGVAAAGLLVNIIAAFLLHSSSSHNLNLRGAYLHVLGDLLGSVGAIAVSLEESQRNEGVGKIGYRPRVQPQSRGDLRACQGPAGQRCEKPEFDGG